jgi:transcription elongation factor Elf1
MRVKRKTEEWPYECPRCGCSTVEVQDSHNVKHAFCRAPMCGWDGSVEEATKKEDKDATS